MSPYDENFDLKSITNRFKTFEGVSYIDNKIQNGIERLGINGFFDSNNLNNIMQKRAMDRSSLINIWQQIFEGSVINEQKKLQQIYDVIESKNNSIPVLIMKTSKSKFKTFFNKKLLEKYKKVIIDEHIALSMALLRTLRTFNFITTPNANVHVTIDENSNNVLVTLMDCSNYERNLFIRTFNEIFIKNEDARYIIKKAGDFSLAACKQEKFFKLINFILKFNKRLYDLPECILKKDNYYFIPEILGTKKQYAEKFVNCLEENFGYFDLYYTKHPKGRKILIKAICSSKENNFIRKSRIWL